MALHTKSGACMYTWPVQMWVTSQCIYDGFVCNGEYDGKDRSDERKCHKMDQMPLSVKQGQNVLMIILYLTVITTARIIQIERIIQKFGACDELKCANASKVVGI